MTGTTASPVYTAITKNLEQSELLRYATTNYNNNVTWDRHTTDSVEYPTTTSTPDSHSATVNVAGNAYS